MRLTATVALLLLFTAALAENYDYYVLATSWAGTTCLEKRCNAAQGISETFFNIHGLWPSRMSGPMGPFACENIPFSMDVFTPNTLSLMKQFWSGLYGSTEDFHNHEWTKHGSCWANDMNGANPIDDYFRKSIELGLRYNAYNALEKGGVTPGKAYTVSQIVKALTLSYKPGSFGLVCSQKGLKEVRICLDRNYQLTECPANVGKFNCGGNVQFPALPSSF